MSVPLGTILPYYGRENQPPTPVGDWLFCNGDTIQKTQFPDLYSLLIGANPDLKIDDENVKLPDLRGEFLRGWDWDREVDKDRKLGSWQPDSMKSHDHSTGPIGVSGGWNGGWGSDQNHRAVNSPGDGPNSTGAYGGDETRPRNIAVNFIMKAKP